MTFKNISLFCIATCLLIACSCKKTTGGNTIATVAYEKVSPDFNADSAYTYVDKQVAFGSRTPNSEAHKLCGDYLVNELKRFGADVQEQKVVLTAYDGKKLNSRNIIGSYGADKKNRVLLFAHWDSRPFSDQDPDPANHRKPVLGADDGASGIGILLEVARVIQTKSPEIGIDIIFFDAEDYGVPDFETQIAYDSKWWCLGSQYWAKNPHIPNYKAKFGILLDIVGGKDAQFYKEEYSRHYAGDVVEKIWNTARDLNYGTYFNGQKGGGITDDHVPVNEYRNIPSVDIINSSPDKGFPSYWHTQKDDMSNISKETLKAVGQTVLEVIYKEKEN